MIVHRRELSTAPDNPTTKHMQHRTSELTDAKARNTTKLLIQIMSDPEAAGPREWHKIQNVRSHQNLLSPSHLKTQKTKAKQNQTQMRKTYPNHKDIKPRPTATTHRNNHGISQTYTTPTNPTPKPSPHPSTTSHPTCTKPPNPTSLARPRRGQTRNILCPAALALMMRVRNLASRIGEGEGGGGKG